SLFEIRAGAERLLSCARDHDRANGCILHAFPREPPEGKERVPREAVRPVLPVDRPNRHPAPLFDFDRIHRAGEDTPCASLSSFFHSWSLLGAVASSPERTTAAPTLETTS